MQISSIPNRLVSPANIVQDKKMSHSSLSLKNSLTTDTFQRQGDGKVSFKGDTGEALGIGLGGSAGSILGIAAMAALGPLGIPIFLATTAAGAKVGKDIGEKL